MKEYELLNLRPDDDLDAPDYGMLSEAVAESQAKYAGRERTRKRHRSKPQWNGYPGTLTMFLQTPMSWGAFRGKKYAALPLNYVEWASSSDLFAQVVGEDIREDMRLLLQYHQRRGREVNPDRRWDNGV